MLLKVGHLILLSLQLAQEALQFLDAIILALVVLFELGADFVKLLDLGRFVCELFLERIDLSQGVVELFAQVVGLLVLPLEFVELLGRVLAAKLLLEVVELLALLSQEIEFLLQLGYLVLQILNGLFKARNLINVPQDVL